MANFYINVYIVERENLFHLCKIRPGTERCSDDLLQTGRASDDVIIELYRILPVPERYVTTQRKFLKILRCPGDYQIRR